MSYDSAPAVIQATPASRHRFHFLDGLRGVASIAVVYWHAPPALFHRNHQSNFLAVDFFFCLSGFVVHHAYADRLRQSLSVSRYFAARLIRLYPLYLLAAVLGVFFYLRLVVPYPEAGTHMPAPAIVIPLQLLLLPVVGVGLTGLLFPVLNPGWSLFFEVVANMAFGALARLRNSWLFFATLYSAGFVVMSRWVMVHHSVDIGWGANPYSFAAGLGRVSLSFFAGVLVNFAVRSLPHWRPGAVINGLLMILLTCLLWLLLLSPLPVLAGPAFHLFALAVLFPLLVFAGAYTHPGGAVMPVMVFLGDFSYPLYLLHYWPCVLLGKFAAPAAVAHPSIRFVFVPALIAILAVVSAGIERFYDLPVRRALTRSLNASQPAPTGRKATS